MLSGQAGVRERGSSGLSKHLTRDVFIWKHTAVALWEETNAGMETMGFVVVFGCWNSL